MTPGQADRFVLRTQTDKARLLKHLDAVRTLADSEKEALGFLPAPAYEEAIENGRIIAMLACEGGNERIAGFVFFGGVFPSARVKAIVVHPDFRRRGVASALVNTLVSLLEKWNYLTVSAAIASDLAAAQDFYEGCGFVATRIVDGGKARQRKIVLRVRELDTPSLLDLSNPSISPRGTVNFGFRPPSVFEAPLYVIDINVLFDVIRERKRTQKAIDLFSAGLAQKVRLAVAPEFIRELENTSIDPSKDVVLKLACSLPRVPSFPKVDVERLAEGVHDAVFVETRHVQAGSRQARSDARHLAQAALIGASGYVTSDRALLDARETLLERFGIDVASLEEVVELLPASVAEPDQSQLRGTRCVTKSTTVDSARAYLVDQGVVGTSVDEFFSSVVLARSGVQAVSEEGEIVGVRIQRPGDSIGAPSRMLVHVRPDHIAAETFAEHLLDEGIRDISRRAPASLELRFLAGQSIVTRAAKLRGFSHAPNSEILTKVALGRPLTANSWNTVSRQARHSTGFSLPEFSADAYSEHSILEVRLPDGRNADIVIAALESALSPTLIAWSGRSGVIVPIAKHFSDDLLDATEQLPLFGRPNAAFVGRRTYFNSPRTARIMRPSMPILFYESERTGGRGAVVAVGRIVDSTILPKDQVPDAFRERGVVEEVESLSKSKQVLATSFDNLMRFPKPVSLDTLRRIGAAGSSNFQTATEIPSGQLTLVLDNGW